MDAYRKIEEMIARKYGKVTTTRKAIGDFMLTENHAVNIKSNNIDKKNYSPNMISIRRMLDWVFEQRKELSFYFVDYRVQDDEVIVSNEQGPIPIEQISWDCLSIEAQGFGVIQRKKPLCIVPEQTKREFYIGFLDAYKKFLQKEQKKHKQLSARFIKDIDSIDW